MFIYWVEESLGIADVIISVFELYIQLTFGFKAHVPKLWATLMIAQSLVTNQYVASLLQLTAWQLIKSSTCTLVTWPI